MPAVSIPGPFDPGVIPDNGRTMPAALRRLRLLDVVNIVVAVVVWVLVILGSDPSINVTDPLSGQVVTAQDARSYYALNLDDLYTGRTDWNTIGAYPYSPAFAQLVYPLNLLPWTWFVAAWTALLIGAVWLLTGRELFLFGMLIGAMEIAGGNVSLLLAAAIVLGFRYPFTWAFVLLTKITPGVGLLWFVVRREWRQLAIALGATAAVVAVSFVLMPQNWVAWIDLLLANTGKGGTWAAIPIPLVVRGPIGVALDHLGRAAQPALGGPGRHDARAARAVVRLAVHAPRRDPADDAGGARAWLGPVQGVRALAACLVGACRVGAHHWASRWLRHAGRAPQSSRTCPPCAAVTFSGPPVVS